MAEFAPFNAGVIQLGRETTPGTLVPATFIWPGEYADISDERVRRRIKQHLGVSNPSARWVDVYLGGRLAMPRTSVAFQTFPHILEAAIRGSVTPGAAPGYERIYNLAVDNSLPALKYYTIEAGNAAIANAAHVMAHSFVESFEIGGEAGEDGTPWEVGPVMWRGARKLLQALTGSLTVPAVTDAVFADTLLYIDDSGGTIGTTLRSDRMKSARVTFNSHRKPVPTAGARYYRSVKPTPHEGQVTFELVFELEDITGLVASERLKYETNAMRLIRLDCPGPSSTYNLRIDLAGYYTSFGNAEDDDGNAIVTVQGQCEVSIADALYATIAVKSGVAVLP